MEDRDNMEIRLWGYIDGICDHAEHTAVAQLIAAQPVWKERYEELMAFHTDILTGLETEEPSVRFTKNVMEMVGNAAMAPSISGYVNKAVIKGIAAFFLLSIVVIMGYILSSADWSTQSVVLTLPKVKLPEVHLPDYTNSTVMNVVIACNVVIGLLLADMMLRRKDRKKQHQ